MSPNRRITLNIIATCGWSLCALVCGLFVSWWVLAAAEKSEFGVSGVIGGMMAIELLAGLTLLSYRNSERWSSRYRSAASRHSTTLHMSIEVFGDATASHKSAEGRYKHYERSQLIVVEKREAVKR